VVLQKLIAALVEPKLTKLELCVVPKFLPLIVTTVPAVPEVGLMLLILGGGVVTLKGMELLVPCFVVTLTLYVPGVKEGMTAWIWLSLQEEIFAIFEPNFTVLVPFVAPKLDPTMVTVVLARPDVGKRF